ncbi:hypothetical protein BJY21_001630 [Kineosphaera limosa]|uniref:Uncharacterized protein n=1 Tax=Kineosphaera limosa NBRC 100340 TaxID=1184609 RepID=K6WZN2_9MICO|nr:hypothetical protein [Kineosphaera limosa]NYE00446.1 hypothetical protein [Kineosphaera limosa]GAB97577.1 hypothetical protein KILIM_074_00260 [Kineosphaera limosa NBRC 100340]
MGFAIGSWILVAAIFIGLLLLVAMLAGRRAEQRRREEAVREHVAGQAGGRATPVDVDLDVDEFDGGAAARPDPGRFRGPVPASGGGAPVDPPGDTSSSGELRDPYDGSGETSYRDVPLPQEAERELAAYESLDDPMFTDADRELLAGNDPTQRADPTEKPDPSAKSD